MLKFTLTLGVVLLLVLMIVDGINNIQAYLEHQIVTPFVQPTANPSEVVQ